MKRILTQKVWLLVALCATGQSFGYYIFFAPNVDPKGRQLPKRIGVAFYKNEERFIKFMKEPKITNQAIEAIVKYGPVFGKIAGAAGGKVVQAAVTAEAGKAGGVVAGKATEEGIKLVAQGFAAIAKAFQGPIRDLQQNLESNHYHGKIHVDKNEKKHPNPRCRSVAQMDKEMQEEAKSQKWRLNEDEPRPLYVVIFNRDNSNTLKGQGYKVLMNKWLYPLIDPKTGQYYKGKGNARGGPFASWVIQTSYQETPIWQQEIPVRDAQGKLVIDPATGKYKTQQLPVIDPKTGKQKIDVSLVADMTMMHDRGGVDCSTNGLNPGNAPDAVGAILPTDTLAATLKSAPVLKAVTVLPKSTDAGVEEKTVDKGDDD